MLQTFELHFDHLEWGSEFYKQNGRYIPEGGLEKLKGYDAVFFGCVGDEGIVFTLFYFLI